MVDTRDCRLDSIKGFLIILVILGHLIGECGTGAVNGGVRTFIYTFHMPLFILISGYLTKIKKNRIFWKGLLNVFVPLCVFQIINAILLILFNRGVGLNMLLIPYWTLWYLLSLIFWRIALQFSPKWLLNSPVLYLIIAVVVSIFCGLMPHGRILSIQRTLNFYPFFLLGYYMHNGGYKRPCNNYLSITLICFVALLIMLGLYPESSGLLLRGADHYNLSQIPSKVYMLACSFATSLSFFYLIRENKVLNVIGKDSMIFYLYHGIIIKFLFKPVAGYFNLPTAFPFMVIYCTVMVLLIYAISKVRIFRWLCNPRIK